MNTIYLRDHEARNFIATGRCRVTRVIVPQPPDDREICGPEIYTTIVIDKDGCEQPGPEAYGIYGEGWDIKLPHRPGDVLAGKETWGNWCYDDPESNAVYFQYRADYPEGATGYWYEAEHENWCDFPRWRSPILMPAEAVRLFPRVTEVKAQRVQEISDDDALDEEYPHYLGIDMYERGDALGWFQYQFDRDNARRGYTWESNPWVRVEYLERVDGK
jgi:hypothetical protein